MFYVGERGKKPVVEEPLSANEVGKRGKVTAVQKKEERTTDTMPIRGQRRSQSGSQPETSGKTGGILCDLLEFRMLLHQ